jgi:hypothetical protein
MSQTLVSPNDFYDAVPDIASDARPGLRRPARPHTLMASLAVAAVTLCLSGASIAYAFTHIPEVDPNADPAPTAEVAAIVADASGTPGKLDVLPPPVYGAGVVSEAPAHFVPLSAHVQMDTSTVDAVDPYKLSEADGVTPPCDDPCSAKAVYEKAKPANAMASDAPQADAKDDDDDNAPTPSGMVVKQ